jgi:hypothetical protein
MKKTIGLKVYNSNGRFYEFYQFSDLPKTLQNELTEYVTNEERETIEYNQYIHIGNRWYGIDEFLTTYNNPWLGNFATEYHENNIHGIYINDYDIAIELSDCNTMYRSWTA